MITLLFMPLFVGPSLANTKSSVSSKTAEGSDLAPLKQVMNFYSLTPTIGTAGQPTPEQFAQIKGAQYSAIINLAVAESANALANEGEIANALDMSYTPIPVPWDAPSAKHVKEFFDVMDALEKNADKVLVHCAANYRASVFTYKYLTLRKGLTADKAKTPLLKEWLPQMDENWRAIMALNIDEIE
jgi:protein tyrosine phosphatase (PTP) superfamily phosphohydrolase (DUF442 family)